MLVAVSGRSKQGREGGRGKRVVAVYPRCLGFLHVHTRNRFDNHFIEARNRQHARVSSQLSRSKRMKEITERAAKLARHARYG